MRFNMEFNLVRVTPKEKEILYKLLHEEGFI